MCFKYICCTVCIYTYTGFGVVSAETLYVSVAAISLGIGYSVII